MTFTFEIPAGVRFTCSRCGDCCRNLHILLMPGERERLAALDWAGGREPSAGEAALASAVTTVAVTDPAHRGSHRLALRDDGACVYLGAQQQCRIHQHFGGDAKPLMCRLYPFGFRAVGDRVGVDVAFSCRAVSLGQGAPVEAAQKEWIALLSEAGHGAGKPPRLSESRKLSPAVAWEIERCLAGFLADASMSLPQRVRCALDFVSLATTGDPETPAAAMLREAIARGLPARVRREPDAGRMDPTQRAVFRQWMFLALNPPPAAFHDMTAEERRRETGLREAAAVAFREAKGAPWLDSRELGVSFAAIDAVDPGPLRTGPEQVATFLSAKLTGWRFLSAGSVELPLIAATRVLFLCYPMIVWAAKALAASAGARGVALDDVLAAIRLVDRTLGQMGTAMLPAKQAEAFEWTMQETGLVPLALAEVLGGQGV